MIRNCFINNLKKYSVKIVFILTKDMTNLFTKKVHLYFLLMTLQYKQN